MAMAAYGAVWCTLHSGSMIAQSFTKLGTCGGLSAVQVDWHCQGGRLLCREQCTVCIDQLANQSYLLLQRGTSAGVNSCCTRMATSVMPRPWRPMALLRTSQKATGTLTTV